MSAHTPGPWTVQQGHYPGFIAIKGPSFDISVVTTATDLDFKDYCSRTADATLIASSPDLLAALKEITSASKARMPEAYMRSVIRDAEIAIARATGGEV